MMKTGLLALGANLPGPFGCPRATLSAAREHLVQQGMVVQASSALWASDPVPFNPEQPRFLNAVVQVATDLRAGDLLARLHLVEDALGRERGERWSARTIDLDLIDLDGEVIPDPMAWQAAVNDMAPVPGVVILPHPRAHLRRFVLGPLLEVAPGWHHPVLGRPAADLLALIDPKSQPAHPVEDDW